MAPLSRSALLLLAGSVLGCTTDTPPKEGASAPPELAEDDDEAGEDEAPDDGGGSGEHGSGGGSDGGETGGEAGGDTGDDGEEEEEEEEEEEPPPPPEVVRFVAMGDGGEGNPDQYAVAEVVAQVCAAKADEHGDGCDFVLYLGDNFYDSGVDDVDDDQFQDKFELPYAGLDVPFMVALGNHDYGETSLEFWKADPQVEYTDRSAKWTMPDKFYTFAEDHARFFALDTNAIMLEGLWGDSGQATWLDGEVASDTSTWRIAYGHHPYISNGRHGNAGNYEGTSWLPIVNGDTVLSFMEGHICGQVDLYLSGHDHNRQWLDPRCGTEFIVSGAAAKTTDFERRDGNVARWETDQSEGFIWIELRDRQLIGEFYSIDGTLDYSHTLNK